MGLSGCTECSLRAAGNLAACLGYRGSGSTTPSMRAGGASRQSLNSCRGSNPDSELWTARLQGEEEEEPRLKYGQDERTGLRMSE